VHCMAWRCTRDSSWSEKWAKSSGHFLEYVYNSGARMAKVAFSPLSAAKSDNNQDIFKSVLSHEVTCGIIEGNYRSIN
jgi:hypothetical protein